MTESYDAIREHFLQPIFECLYYDGENGEYRLLDFNPNKLSKEKLKSEIKQCLLSFGIEPEYLDKAIESVYLIDTNNLIKFNQFRRL